MFIGFLLITTCSFRVSGTPGDRSCMSGIRAFWRFGWNAGQNCCNYPRPPVYQALAPGNMLLALRIATHNYLSASRHWSQAIGFPKFCLL
ncbi:hypothetical protein QT971_10050 [Microcoleus sp. herbarium19]|uniref:hypothetical protein n=1 Tax=unclassified Microcoleus TaxID=2642155 RepID=UPI002FD4EEC3